MTESRYQVQGKIGQGGLGEVYLAKDTQLDRDVALKRVKVPEDGNADAMAADLIREARTLSVLQHPNIVTVYDVGKDEKGPFVVLELLKGETLDQVIQRGGMTPQDFTEVVTQSLEGLIAAQAVGLVHRDLKPGNIMVIWLASGKFQIKILDFGLAKFSQKARPQTEDHGGGIFGSIFFMAPEQFERLPLDARTDMYSLGCIYYQILTTKHPFDGETGMEVMVSHLQHHVIPVQQVRPDIPEWLCNWVMWLISREMDDRPQDAKTALHAFNAQQHGLKNAPPPRQQQPAGPQNRPGNPGMPRGPMRGPVMPQQGGAPNQTQPVGTMVNARLSTQNVQRVPGQKSKLPLIIILSVLGLALVSGIGYMLWPKGKKQTKESAPNSAEKVLIDLNSKKADESTPPTPTPPDAPNPTVNQPPTPVPPPVPAVTPDTKPPSPPQPVPVQIVELPPAELDRALMATVFLPVKSSERFKAFQTTLITKGAGKFNVERHSKILRLIVHETSEKFARDLKQPALAEQIKIVHDKRIKAQPAEIRNIRASECDIYSPNESAVWSEEKQAVINWKNAETRLAFDISSDVGRYRIKINQACPNPEGQSFRVIFGKDISNPTAPLKTAGEMAFVENDAGTFVVVKNGTYRLWIEPVAMPKSGDFMRVRGITIEKIKP